MQLFTVEGLYGTTSSKTINNQRHHYYACGNVIIKKADGSGGSIRGYIVDKYETPTANKWLIHTVSGSEIQINQPQPLGNYNYDLTNTFNYKGFAHKLIEYHPARIVIWKKNHYKLSISQNGQKKKSV